MTDREQEAASLTKMLDGLDARSVVMDGTGEVWRKASTGRWDCLDANGDQPTEDASTVVWQSLPPRVTVLWTPAHRSPAPALPPMSPVFEDKLTDEEWVDRRLAQTPADERGEASDREVLRRILSRFDPSDVERTITAIRGNGFARPDHDAEPDEDTWEYGLTWEPSVTGSDEPQSYAGCETEESAWEAGRRLAGGQTPRVWKRPMRPAVQAVPAGPWEPVTPRGEEQ
ncbi:hypothetical protein [Microbacterium sp.]|uniref:hypothetical protein n=1 Tax=Microbacterium sp. TaxID=51671 RepID=UPI0039E25F60